MSVSGKETVEPWKFLVVETIFLMSGKKIVYSIMKPHLEGDKKSDLVQPDRSFPGSV